MAAETKRPMRRRTKVLLASGVAVVVLGAVGVIVGPMIYANAVNGSAEAAPSLGPTGHASLGADEADGSWRAASGSFAGYRVHEVLNGNDVNVVGRTSKVDATVDVAGGSLTSGKISVRVADISTPESARDAYFRSTALQTDRFPTATFTLAKPVDVGSALGGGNADVTLDGTLALHGVTKQVSVDAQVAPTSDDEVQVVGSIPITFSDYGVTAPSLGFVTVDKSGAVEFSLDLRK